MEQILDQLVNGLTVGAQYALIAAGLSLLFGVLGIVNFAHGELYMAGAFLVYVATTSWDLPYALAGVVTVLGMAVVGALFYALVIRRLLDRGWQVQLVATVAVSIILTNVAIVVAGSVPKSVHSPLTLDIVTAGPLRVSQQRILVLAVAVATFTALALFLKRTRTGKAMRAVSQSREAAAVVGISVRSVGLAVVTVSTMLAGVAAVLIAPLQTISPTMGTLVVIKAFAAVIAGGLGNVGGAIAAAFAIGLVEAFAIGYVTSAYADALVFALMIAVLLFKPHGIFGREVRA
jgi:branched-chain amino acid transport system permease protein